MCFGMDLRMCFGFAYGIQWMYFGFAYGIRWMYFGFVYGILFDGRIITRNTRKSHRNTENKKDWLSVS